MRGRLRPIASSTLAAAADPSGHGMVRQARQLRHSLRSKPAELHRQLARLSSKRPQAHSAPSARIVSAISASTHQDQRPDVGTATELFTREVRRHLGLPTGQGGQRAKNPAENALLLRYSQRLELLRLGEHMGLSRFQANLVIAAVQHEWHRNHGATAVVARQGPSTTSLFLATQALLIATLVAVYLIAGV